MRGLARVVWLVVAVGCSSSSNLPPIQGEGADGYNVSGTLYESTTFQPWVGASVCVTGKSSACTTSGSTGGYLITGVPSTPTTLTVTGTGDVPAVVPLTLTGDIDNIDFSTLPTAEMSAVAQGSGATFGPTTGVLAFQIFDANGQPLAGATLVTSAAGQVAYVTGGFEYDATLTSTSSAGAGAVFDLPVGTTNVTVTEPGMACVTTLSTGWAATKSGATGAVPIVGGQDTQLLVECQ